MEKIFSDAIAAVDPQRQAFVRHRIAVLERYREILDPQPSDTKSFAYELGLTTAGFRRLFRVWVEKRSPVDLAAVGGPRRPAGPRPHKGDEFVRRIFPTLPKNQSVSAVISALYAAAEKEGVTLRGWGGMRNLVNELTFEQGVGQDDDDLLFIDFAALQIPVMHPESGKPSMPIASVLGRAGCILTVRLSMAPVSAGTAVELLKFAKERGLFNRRPDENASSSLERKIRMDVGNDTGWVSWLGAMADAGFEHEGRMTNKPQGGAGGRLVHPRLLGFVSRPQMILRDASHRPATLVERIDEVVTLQAAQEAIDARLQSEFEPKPIPFPSEFRRLLEAAKSHRE